MLSFHRVRDSFDWLLFLFFTAGLCLNLIFLFLYYHPSAKYFIGDEHTYYQVATTIAAGQSVISDPLWPPLYGEGLGLLFQLCGNQLIVVQGVQIVLWMVTAFFFYQIVDQVLHSRLAAYAAL